MNLLARAILIFAFLGSVLLAIASAVAGHRLGRRFDVPATGIVATTLPARVAHGERLFRTLCAGCHVPLGPEPRRAVGGHVSTFADYAGTLEAPNLTHDASAGIGARSDEELARLLRFGVRPDKTYAFGMPRMKALADDDVSDILGFLRSDHPWFHADGHQAPAPDLGIMGRIAIGFSDAFDVEAPAHVRSPAPGPTPAYGRYLATAIYGCVACHTTGEGNADAKLASPDLLAGGLALRTPRGDPIFSSNLTPSAGGLGAIEHDELARTLRLGIGRHARPLRAPMPIFRLMTDQELDGLLAFLRSVPPRPDHIGITDDWAPPPPTAGADEIFARQFCGACHGAGPLDKALRQAATLDEATLAARILHPEATRPESQMPTYAAVLDEPTATKLAAYVKAHFASHALVK